MFAPAAAALAAGARAGSLGTPLTAPPMPLPVTGSAVLWVDRFGNLVTNVRPPIGSLVVNGRLVSTVAETFGEAPPDTLFLYVGSMGFVEVGVREARADERLGARPGTPVHPVPP